MFCELQIVQLKSFKIDMTNTIATNKNETACIDWSAQQKSNG